MMAALVPAEGRVGSGIILCTRRDDGIAADGADGRTQAAGGFVVAATASSFCFLRWR